MNRLRAEEGTMIVEVIVALVVITIVAVGVGKNVAGSSNLMVTQANVSRLTSAAEEAWEEVLATKPWRTTPSCLTGTCDVPVSFDPAFPIRVTLEARAYGTNAPGRPARAYHVRIIVTPIDGGGAAVAGFTPVSMVGDVQDARARDVGTLRVTDCRVNQVDERSWPGSCPAKRYVRMVPPKGLNYIYPGFPMWYGINPTGMQWENAVAAGAATVVHTPVQFTVDLQSIDLDSYSGGSDGMVNLTGQPPGYFTAKDANGLPVVELPAGKYRIRINDELAGSTEYIPWRSKAIPSNAVTNQWFEIRISAGVETLVATFYQPQFVDVTLNIRSAAGFVPWRPYWSFKWRNDDVGFERWKVMLIPFPHGRAIIPGVKDGDTVINRSVWPEVQDDQGTVTFNRIRPGLYRAQYYSYSCDRSLDCTNDNNWELKTWPISKIQLGLGADHRWDEGPNPPYSSEHSRLPYLFVYRNGTIGPLPRASLIYHYCWALGPERAAFAEEAKSHGSWNNWRWFWYPGAGWSKLRQIVGGGIDQPGGYMIFRAARGKRSDIQPGTNSPLKTNRYKSLFYLENCKHPAVDIYSGGSETT